MTKQEIHAVIVSIADALDHRNDGTVLHGIRNEFGPTWLMNYKLPKGE